ncbi:MAG: hypothetical protein IPO88_23275 [Nannocystis sp.]|uniref:hypothetical protein n=1 Tax=Nannocystis sp. TaxID=1962667 RepID=UPI002429334B|nr:hypothetical protein [Nannocystis sp.]MBK9756365.1 hypothetical protein [Nannocystis sp.]
MAKQHNVFGTMRAFALPVWLLLALGVFLWRMNPHYPIQHWLFWRYAGYWVACAAFAAASLGLGHAIVRRITGPRLPLLQHLSIAFPVGVFGFELLMFFAGHLQLYRPWLFFAFPVLLIAATGPRLVRDARRWATHLRAHSRRAPRLAWWQWALPAFGLLALSLLYFGILTPDNVQFDARWRHLALPEDYVAHGGLHRFGEGLTASTGSRFHGFLYTWAFLVPGKLFDRIELAQHIEFTIFLFTTLITIPAMVRWMVPGADPRLVWAARFLFPGVFCYDSNLSGNVDHIAGLFCAPLLLSTVRALRDLNPRHVLILSMMLPALIMGKETAAVMMAPMAILLVAGRAGQFAVQAARHRLAPRRASNWWRGPVVAVVGVVVFSAPHWLNNVLWHGDPFYPILHKYFDARPWAADATYNYDSFLAMQLWAPPRTLAGVWETLQALYNFSFIPNDWKNHHGMVPVFGSLMTLLLPCLLFVRRTRRVWFLVAWVHLAIFLWYWVNHQDRYLQTIVPWMSAITAAIIVLVWRQSRLVTRGALVALVSFQIVWGGDVPFFQTHSMAKSPIKKVVDLLSSGYKRNYDKRLDTQGTYAEIGRALPAGARLLMHENHAHLGVGVTSISDWSTWQFGLSYGLLASPRDVYDAYVDLGVTHVHWVKLRSRAWDSVAADLMFFDFALRRTVKPRRFGKTILAEMPAAPPVGPDEFDDSVVVLGCGRGYATGSYRVSDLQTKEFGTESHVFAEPRVAAPARPTVDEVEALIRDVAFVVLDPTCNAKVRPAVTAKFEHAATRGRVSKHRNVQYELYLRKPVKSPGKAAARTSTAKPAAEPAAPVAEPARPADEPARPADEPARPAAGPPAAPADAPL